MTRGEGGAVQRLSGDQLVEQLPALSQTTVSVETLTHASSENIDLETIVAVAGHIQRANDGGVDGIVVTIGTDSLEESAFGLDVLLRLDLPVVLTGALRNSALPSADGPANLLGAVRVACAEAARGLGVVVVLNNEIHAARFVHKAHTYALEAFVSAPCGPLGWIVEDRVQIALRPIARAPHVPLSSARAVPYVPLLTTFGGDDGRLLSSLQRDDVAGVVIQTLGSGHVAEGLVEPLTQLARQIPVVFTSRIPAGDLFHKTYEYSGAEIDLLSRGLISGNYIGGPKARALLAILLASGASRAQIERAFAELETAV